MEALEPLMMRWGVRLSAKCASVDGVDGVDGRNPRSQLGKADARQRSKRELLEIVLYFCHGR